jgi:ribosomal-protein-alanine N-acetyltransferase
VDLKLTTVRLELVASTVDHLRAELTDRPQFAAMLEARVPKPWPPPLNDEDSANWAIAYLQDHPDAVGWSMWYFILLDEGLRTAIGNGGFKGRPDPHGTAEIGYSVVEAYQRHGYASEAVAALISWAFQHRDTTRVVAETYPELVASIRVMEKNGLRFLGQGSEEHVIQYGITREEFERRTDHDENIAG